MNRVIRALPPRAQAWVLDHAFAGVALVLFVVAAVCTVIFVRPDPVRETAYLRASVVSSADASSDTGFFMRFLLELPEGQRISVSTSSLALAMSVVRDACLKVENRASGLVRYTLELPERCDRET